jgi:hypothetical protein
MTSAPTTNEGRTKPIQNFSTTQTVCAFLLLYFLMRLPWLMTLPVTEAPDELNHYWVVHYIAQHWSLPSFESVHSAGPAAEYGALPPLGYIPQVLLIAFAPESLQPMLSRFGSLLIGAVVPWIAVLMGKELFPAQRLLALALPLLAVFHPQLVFVNSYTNNDSMATSLASVIVYMLIRGINSGLSTSKVAIIGAMFGILGLSKHTGLSVAPAVLFGIAIAGYTNALTVAQILAKLAVFGLTFVLASGWFFVHNYFEFKGDILGTKTMYESWITILPKENGHVVHPWPKASQIGWWRYVFFDYVGLFGYMDRYLWRPIYFVYLGYMITAFIGWLRGFRHGNILSSEEGSGIAGSNLEGSSVAGSVVAGSGVEGSGVAGSVVAGSGVEGSGVAGSVVAGSGVAGSAVNGSPPSVGSPRAQWFVWIMIVAFPLCNLLANLAATIVNVTGPHGRYLFPSELCILALTIAGLSRFKIGKQLVVSLIALNALITVGVWLCWYMPGRH